MNAETLKIVAKGYPQFVYRALMREWCSYNIVSNTFNLRWDTVIYGKQEMYEVCGIQYRHMNNLIERLRDEAHKHFEAIEEKVSA